MFSEKASRQNVTFRPLKRCRKTLNGVPGTARGTRAANHVPTDADGPALNSARRVSSSPCIGKFYDRDQNDDDRHDRHALVDKHARRPRCKLIESADNDRQQRERARESATTRPSRYLSSNSTTSSPSIPYLATTQLPILRAPSASA